MHFLRSAFIVGFWTFLSRLFGYVRDIALAAVLGTTPMADAWNVAFRLPNFFRRIVAEGAMQAAFIPLYTSIEHGQSHAQAVAFARRVMGCLLLCLGVSTLCFMAGMHMVVGLFAPGFSDSPDLWNTTTQLARITFPYLICIAMVSLLSGMLQVMRHYAAAAAAPLLLNGCMLAGISLHEILDLPPAHALAYSVAIAGVLQWGWMLWSAWRAGLCPWPSWPVLDQSIRTLLRRMIPGMVGGSAVQLNIIIDTVLASYISGAITMLSYAERLINFPLAIIGTAIGTVSLPAFSALMNHQGRSDFFDAQNRTLEAALLLTLPASVALLIIAPPLMEVLFVRGAFSYADGLGTAHALMAYALGLTPFVLIKILSNAFFAAHNTRTPVQCSLIAVLVNIICSLCLMIPLKHVGFALAATISAWCHTGMLAYTLHAQQLWKPDRRLITRLLGMLAACAVMGVVLVLCRRWPVGVMSLIGTVGLGGLSYMIAVFGCKGCSWHELRKLVQRPA